MELDRGHLVEDEIKGLPYGVAILDKKHRALISNNPAGTLAISGDEKQFIEKSVSTIDLIFENSEAQSFEFENNNKRFYCLSLPIYKIVNAGSTQEIYHEQALVMMLDRSNIGEEGTIDPRISNAIELIKIFSQAHACFMKNAIERLLVYKESMNISEQFNPGKVLNREISNSYYDLLDIHPYLSEIALVHGPSDWNVAPEH